ncbi:tRNA (adenosine(37)-N6)-threonylcarbamoyltransferase complex dimerization subunit type 1 TsaB [Ruminococcus sp.]|uniref:tRNA (adenosine(37)-N6)-threonylcarbamoyltransferase complex dimerization subunit type 1 TsaB n=1 Tax=Ruminococcus sp. TaxID=41978 RepID=UPI0025E50B65|nr:tRNA (adenosine(37)-N6)-threonylcarbamoyltransferase complex dimerization subunit type 1 TsaB [Ruminococcus sp.]
MLTLGIDTSGKTASAALFDADNEVFLAGTSLYTQKTHSQVIMPIVKDILAQAGKTVGDIDLIAVADGPGSYTGLRIGVAAVKAMGFALDCKCCGVSTLEALAYNNIAHKGTICSIMKARGELVYTCSYKSDGYGLEPLCDEQIIPRDQLAEFLAFNGTEALLCGDGAADFFTAYRSPMFILAPPQGRLQNAYGVCLGAMSKQPVTADELEVSYLQKVKAEKDLQDKMNNTK